MRLSIQLEISDTLNLDGQGILQLRPSGFLKVLLYKPTY